MVEYGDDTAMTWVRFPVDVLFLSESVRARLRNII